jgi:hypothetical protein
MTNQQHPITPPPELVQQWWEEADQYQDDPKTYFDYVATEAAQWGADKELLACGNYLKQCAAWEEEDVIEFYNYRRPKPPSLKEQALKALNDISIASFEQDAANTIRQALESLPD